MAEAAARRDPTRQNHRGRRHRHQKAYLTSDRAAITAWSLRTQRSRFPAFVAIRSSPMHRILLVGVARGGTTWIGKALGSTDSAVYVNEPDGLTDPYAFRAKLHLHHHPMLAVGDSADDYTTLWDGAFSGGAVAETARDRLARRLFAGTTHEQRNTARQAGSFTPRLRLAAMLAVPRVAVDVENVIVKSVNSAFSTEWIVDKFDPAVGVITRNPLSVLASWRKFGWAPPQHQAFETVRALMAERFDIGLPDIGASPLARSTAMIGALAFTLDEAAARHPEWVTIDHEAMSLAPTTKFAEIATRLGLTWTDSASAFVAASSKPGTGYTTQRVAADVVDSWKRLLTPAEITEAQDVLARFTGARWTSQME